MQKFKQYSEGHDRLVSKGDTIITKDQFIDFVNWMGMSDVVVREENDGRFRIQFVEIEID